MKKLITIVSCWAVITCQAQMNGSASRPTGGNTSQPAVDSAGRVAASYFKEAAGAGKDQRVWNEKIYGPMLFVDPHSRVTYGNMADSGGILTPDGEVYKGVLPSSVIIANTAIDWEGKKWSVILWPLPTDHDERLNLMMHESFHRIQASLGLQVRSPTADHLSGMYGRIYYLLELQALKAALGKPVDQRSKDLTNALLFREKREELFPNTFENERVLEMNEGLAEYTGVILGRQRDSIRPHLYTQIDSSGGRKSLIRSFEYTTGPVYGYLLYERSPDWTQVVDSNSSFPALISKFYNIPLPIHPVGEKVAALEKQYNGDAIVRSEKLKEEERLKMANKYTDLFTRKPVLTIELKKMNIGFNPSSLFDLGEYGTVYPVAEVKDIWGHLIVSAPGMLMKDWEIVTLAAGEGIHTNGNVVEGNGWKLELNEHWEIVKVDSLHSRLVGKN
jgi:hypothetical protein